jgi:hypothetical protein
MAAAERVLRVARRCLPYAVGLGLPAAVLSPIGSGAADSFPISTYPMFANPRGQPTLHTLVGLTPDGNERRLPPELVGTKEVLQAKVLIQRSVVKGPEAMSQLCAATATRAAASATFRELQALAIVARRYDPIEYFVKGPTPLDEQTLVRCELPGAEGARVR